MRTARNPAVAKVPLPDFYTFGTISRETTAEAGADALPSDDVSYNGIGVAAGAAAVVLGSFFWVARVFARTLCCGRRGVMAAHD